LALKFLTLLYECTLFSIPTRSRSTSGYHIWGNMCWLIDVHYVTFDWIQFFTFLNMCFSFGFFFAQMALFQKKKNTSGPLFNLSTNTFYSSWLEFDFWRVQFWTLICVFLFYFLLHHTGRGGRFEYCCRLKFHF